MTIDQLRTFLAILDRGSFTRAAESLGVSQSTASFHLRALEAGLGRRLLDRAGGKVRPTAEGRALRAYARRLVALHDEAEAALAGGVEPGELRISASTIPAEYLLPPVLAELRAAHPSVRIAVSVSDSGGALAALLAHESEVALVGRLRRDRRLAAFPFADDQVLLVGAPSNPWAPRGRLAAEELARVPLVVREEGSGTLAAAGSLVRGHAGPRLEVGSPEAVKRCVLAGLGLAFVSHHAVGDEIAGGRLARIALPGTPIARRFHAVRLAAATPSRPAATLLALLRRARK